MLDNIFSDIFNMLNNSTGTLSVEEILSNFLAALVFGSVIYLSYRFSHAGAVYSPRFNASLLMMTLVTTLVMNIIGNNIALSLGMVGALSIIRFRTAIKDSRDATYIFWCIAVGICCGVSEYFAPSIGSGVIFLVMLILGAVRSNNRYLLIIHSDAAAGDAVEQAVLVAYSGKAQLRVKNTTPDSRELIYELSWAIIKKPLPGSKKIEGILYEIDGVRQVDIVMQNEEVSQ